MKNTHPDSLEPFGQALLAYWQGNKSAVLVHEFKNGLKKKLPVSVFFRSHEEFLSTDNALAYCRGQILVVGAGTGVHALELEKRGYSVTSIDLCPQAVQIMKERGLKDARHQDFLCFEGEQFDTVLILGHNIGICETLEGIKGFLHRCKRILRPNGQMIVNSVKEKVETAALKQEGYPGELEFRLSYENHSGPWMRWLHVDFQTLSSHALKYGWSTEKLIDTDEGFFLARLRPDG